MNEARTSSWTGSRGAELYKQAWLKGFRFWGAYFRYECEGFEHLRLDRSALLVGYHGMPFPIDIFILSTRMHDELGYIPHAFWLDTWGRVPFLKDLVGALGGFLEQPTHAQVERVKAARRHFVVCPGGTREALRPFWKAGSLEWGERRGYARFALRHRLPVIPVAASGVDRAWIGLNDGYRLSKRLFGHGGIPVWGAVGLGGLWPTSLPFPVRIRQSIGAPIDPTVFDATDETAAAVALDRAVRAAITRQLSALRGR